MRGRYPASSGYSYQFGPGPWTPAIKAIIIACGAVFLIDQLVVGRMSGISLAEYFGLMPFAVIEGLQVWQLGTYLFLHGGVFHLLFNMLALWMFGVELERMWGTRFFLKYYFACGLGAAATTMILPLLPLGLHEEREVPSVGRPERSLRHDSSASAFRSRHWRDFHRIETAKPELLRLPRLQRRRKDQGLAVWRNRESRRIAGEDAVTRRQDAKAGDRQRDLGFGDRPPRNAGRDGQAHHRERSPDPAFPPADAGRSGARDSRLGRVRCFVEFQPRVTNRAKPAPWILLEAATQQPPD
jgi:hypothetical protein